MSGFLKWRWVVILNCEAWRRSVEEEELDSSSHPHGPTGSFPWTTYPDLRLNSILPRQPFCHFLSTLEVYHLPRPYTSHSNHPLHSEILLPPQLSLLLFLAHYHPHPNVNWGSLFHSAILTLLPFRRSLTPYLPTVTITSFLLWPASNSGRWCWPSSLLMELPLSTS